MNNGQQLGTQDCQNWKSEIVQRLRADILNRGLALHRQGIDRFTADDVDTGYIAEKDRNVIGTAFSGLAHAKHPLLKPVMFQTDEGLQQMTRRSAKDQAHNNALTVWSICVPEAVLWLRKHGHETPQPEPQLALLEMLNV